MGEKLFVKFDDCKILAINLNRKKEINCHFRFVIFYLREKEKKTSFISLFSCFSFLHIFQTCPLVCNCCFKKTGDASISIIFLLILLSLSVYII